MDLLDYSRDLLKKAEEAKREKQGKVRATSFGDGRSGGWEDFAYGIGEEVLIRARVVGFYRPSGTRRRSYKLRALIDDPVAREVIGSIILADEPDLRPT